MIHRKEPTLQDEEDMMDATPQWYTHGNTTCEYALRCSDRGKCCLTCQHGVERSYYEPLKVKK